MPTVLEEGNLRFTFDDAWHVIKLDECDFFRNRLMPLQLTKGVDILAIRQSRELLFIEIKDYRGSAIELKNNEKLCAGDSLHLQVARKVKDSVACMTGAARVLDESPWPDCADILRARHKHVRVVFWLEFDLGRHRPRNPNAANMIKTRASVRQKQLKQALNWLTKEVIVTNQVIDSSTFSGVIVQDTGRAGHR